MSQAAGAGASAEELIARFGERAEAVGSVVHRVDGWEGLARIAAELADGGQVVVAPRAAEDAGLRTALGAGAVAADPDDPLTASLDAPVGVVLAEMAVAETGSVVIDEEALADRAVSMLTRTLVQAVPAERLVASLDDVAEWLAGAAAGPGYRSLISGPSRTADIERSLTVGVQGPSAVHVVVVG